MNAVLGLSMTPTTVGIVLVDGHDADSATMDHETLAVPDWLPDSPRSGAAQTSQAAVDAVRRSEALASARGLRLQSIGVTWSDDAELEASLLLKSLANSGFDNVVPVRLPEATEALARGIAQVIGYQTTAVCVIEPDSAIALIVHSGDGSVQTAVSHAVESEQQLVNWLEAVFNGADWRPAALVVVGSAGAFDVLLPRLQQALGIPVFTPAEAELALARGAALASTHSAGPAAGTRTADGTGFGFAPFVYDADAAQVRETARARSRRAQAGPIAMLVGGALTFVVSASLAIGLQLSPEEANSSVIPQHRPAAADQPAVVRHTPPPAAVPAAIVEPPPQAPPPEPVPEAPPVEVVTPVVPEAVPEPVPGAPPAPDVSAQQLVPPPPVEQTFAPQVPAVAPQKPTLRERILSKIPGLDRFQNP